MKTQDLESILKNIKKEIDEENDDKFSVKLEYYTFTCYVNTGNTGTEPNWVIRYV